MARNTKMRRFLDIGGEGRYRNAWCLNPRSVKTLGPERGQPIPRLILGRADHIPCADGSLDCILVERTPLTARALREIARTIAPAGRIILRHIPLPWQDRHATAKAILPGQVRERLICRHGRVLLETQFVLDRPA